MRTSIRRSALVLAGVAALSVGVVAPANAGTAPNVIGMPGTEALAAFQDEGFTNVYLSIPGSDNPVLSTSLHRGFSAPDDTHILILLKYIPTWQADDE